MKKVLLSLGTALSVLMPLAASAAPVEVKHFCEMTPASYRMPVKENAVMNSVQYWNNKIQSTNRVLDRSYCAPINEQWAEITPRGPSVYTKEVLEMNKRLQQESLSQFCRLHVWSEGGGQDASECGKGLSSR